MAKTNIGRVSVVPKGEYSSTENYKRLDVVSSDGSMYISKKDNNIGNPLTDENWWFKAVEKGEVGAQGEKPVNGVDYNTLEEKEEFKNDVVSKATEEVEKNIADAETKAIENYNKNADEKTTEYNTNADNKLKTYNDNTTEKLKEYNDNASEKLESYNTNSTSKVNEFNTNATNKTNSFDENATAKTNAFNSNAATKTNDFNDNYDEKMQAINEASTSIEVERIESDKRYAKAIDSDIVSVNGFGQVEIEQDGYAKDIEIESTLPEITQKTREGYNEIENEIETCSMGGIDITRNLDGSVTLNGTATENITLYYSTKERILNGTYIFYLYGKNGININLQGTENGSSVAYLTYSSSEKYAKKVYDSDTVLSNFYSYIAVGKTFKNETFYPMLTKGEEVKLYEQYGASPSLDYPSKFENMLSSFNIKNVVDEIEKYNKQITLAGNNFLGNFNGYKNIIQNGKLYNNLKIYKVDSSTDFSINATDDNRVQFLTPVIDNLKPELGQNDILSNIAETSGSSSTKKIRFWISYEELGTTSENTNAEHVAALKNKLSNITGEFLYPVDNDNEEETSLEEINLQLYQGINNISAEDLKISFKQNMKVIAEKTANSRYAKALKANVEDIEQTQIYAENDVVENLTIKGVELTQKTREGYNFLINNLTSKTVNGITFTVQEDKSILVNGTATDLTVVNILNDSIGADSTSSILCEIPDNVTSGILSGCPSGGSSSTYKIDLWSTISSLVGTDTGNEANLDFTIKERRKINRARIVIYAGTTVNNLVFKPMIVTSSENKEYEQYGASPSLNYPSEIKMTNEQNIQISKNNIFNIANITGLNSCTIDNNILTTSPMNTYGAFKIAIASKKLFKGTVYLSFDVRVLSGTTNNLNIARFNDALEDVIKLTTIGSLNISSNWTRVKFKTTLEENYELKNIWVQIANSMSTVLEVKNIMISYYDVEYEDYYDINNSIIPLVNSAIGKYADIIDRKNDIQNKVIQELVLTGDENYRYIDIYNGIYQYNMDTQVQTLSNDDYVIRAMSNYFKGIGRKNSWLHDNTVTTEANKIRFMTSEYTTVEDFKAKIKELYEAGTPVKIYYVSKTIDKIPLSEEIKQELNKFKLYDDLNNIFIDNGTLSFKYNKSLSKELEEKDEMIDNLLTRVQALEAAQVNSVGGN